MAAVWVIARLSRHRAEGRRGEPDSVTQESRHESTRDPDGSASLDLRPAPDEAGTEAGDNTGVERLEGIFAPRREASDAELSVDVDILAGLRATWESTMDGTREASIDPGPSLDDGAAEWTAPTDAVPADATPTDAAPTDAALDDAVPADVAPADALPADAAPADATSASAAPADATSASAAPADTASASAVPTDVAPADAVPADAAPASAAPASAAPASAASASAVPADVAPVDALPADAAPTDATPPISIDMSRPLVYLTLVAKRERVSGQVVLDSLAAEGFRPGLMQLYYWRSDAEPSVVFGVANMVEPGVLDPDELPAMETPGLVTFMSVPQDTASAFRILDAMVEVSRRLARRIDAALCDETRSTLTAQAANHLRETVADILRRGRL